VLPSGMLVVRNRWETKVPSDFVFIDGLSKLDNDVAPPHPGVGRQQCSVRVLVLHAVRRATSDVNEVPWRYVEGLVTDRGREVTLEDVEPFLSLIMDVGIRTAMWRESHLHRGDASTALLTAHQKPEDVTKEELGLT
jgi:hypothetical protein